MVVTASSLRDERSVPAPGTHEGAVGAHTCVSNPSSVLPPRCLCVGQALGCWVSCRGVPLSPVITGLPPTPVKPPFHNAEPDPSRMSRGGQRHSLELIPLLSTALPLPRASLRRVSGRTALPAPPAKSPESVLCESLPSWLRPVPLRTRWKPVAACQTLWFCCCSGAGDAPGGSRCPGRAAGGATGWSPARRCALAYKYSDHSPAHLLSAGRRSRGRGFRSRVDFSWAPPFFSAWGPVTCPELLQVPRIQVLAGPEGS